ncbi:exo-alpha-sialidase [Actinophytocola oryzae]|uniref:F5/8 type C domain-containing protein n=1 Tax=Actinophytocola oryzae TaxID=502181 RepID=A0A4R7W355_9PSEU|nr:exo-alpha-sialidase [Actinophytocola oryzae]TDV56478.1 F5/8 type C domain-containing protein [Actinophytocola oryzae]
MSRVTNLVSAALGFGAAVVLLAATTGSAAPGGPPPTAENPLPTGDGAAASSYASGNGPLWNVLNWGPGPRAANPGAFAMDTVVDGRTEQKIFVSSSANDDTPSADSINNLSTSLDSGLSFLTTQRNAPVGAGNMVRLDDGSLVAVDFIPEWRDDAHSGINLRVWRSPDGGATWRLTKAPYTPPPGKVLGGDRGLRVHREAMLAPDGTIMVPAYLAYVGERQGSIILQSVDGGGTWTQRGQIPAPVAVNEVGWSFTTDDRMVAAVRTGESPPRLRTSFSADQGRTWSPAEPLLGPDGTQVVGISPQVLLQPNGVMLLATGRPDDRVYVSHDGTGRTWDEQRLVLARYPSETGNGRSDGTSGNNAMVSVDADRTVFFGDYCAVWGCKAYHEQYGIFASYVSAVTPGTGRIDLETKAHNGTVKITGDFARGDRRFPEQRPEGAVDGSSRSHSAAVLDRRRGNASMTVELDRAYPVNRLGVMLGNGQPSSATVSLSADGRAWTPVVRADRVRDHAVRYTDLAPTQARFVRIEAPSGTAVTELEVFAAGLQTFENDPEYAVPRGFVDARNTTVTDQELRGADSRDSLRLFDKFLDDNATATAVAPDVEHQTLAFSWATNDFRGPFTFSVGGHRDGAGVEPWRFRLRPGPPRTLEVYDGSTWQALGTLTTAIPNNTWTPFVVDATTTAATVRIGGQEFTTTTRAEAADTIAGTTFTTGDPVEYGMTFFVDDLAITGA